MNKARSLLAAKGRGATKRKTHNGSFVFWFATLHNAMSKQKIGIFIVGLLLVCALGFIVRVWIFADSVPNKQDSLQEAVSQAIAVSVAAQEDQSIDTNISAVQSSSSSHTRNQTGIVFLPEVPDVSKDSTHMAKATSSSDILNASKTSSPTLLGIDMHEQLLQEKKADVDGQATQNESNFPDISLVKENFSFYELLTRPTQKFTPPVKVDSDTSRMYVVTSGLIRTREMAYSLRAQLFFLGFSNINIEPKKFNNHTWYRIKVHKINSRSKTNRVKDFFADRNIQSLSLAE